MNKISHYFSTFVITRGLLISILFSSFIYLAHWGISIPALNTILALLALYLLLDWDQKIWFWSGTFIGIFWFWWMIMSFKHYQMLWAIPIGLLFISLVYGFLFWVIATLAAKVSHYFTNHSSLVSSLVKSFGLLIFSYIHPFGFDWFKPELLFVESYIGIYKWQFAIVLFAMTLTLWRRNILYLFLVIFAYQPLSKSIDLPSGDIEIHSTHIPVEEKWNSALHPKHFKSFFEKIDRAIEKKKSAVILPESLFPVFINRSKKLLGELTKRAEKIDIITGGLYADGQIPRNSTYIFTNKGILVANKVVLVPFGESNPLPGFLSNWVNEVFYDGAVDYIASANFTDYKIADKKYRNAICFEATSEKLYEGTPQAMIVLSNNGWFVPSTEPTLQKLLLLYYNKKYDTTIYHSINMSPSYIIKNGRVILVGEK